MSSDHSYNIDYDGSSAFKSSPDLAPERQVDYTSDASTKPKNQLTDDVWIIHDHVKDQDFHLSWSEQFPSIDIEKVFLGKQILLSKLGGYTDSEGGLYQREGTFNYLMRPIIRLLEYWQGTHPDTKLQNWSVEMVTAWALYELKNKEANTGGQSLGKIPVLARNTLNVIFPQFPIALHNDFMIGKIGDGFMEVPSQELLNARIKDELESLNVDYAQWCSGGSYGSVPIEIAMLLLGDAIETLRSDRTKCLKGFYEFVRPKKGEISRTDYINFVERFNVGLKTPEAFLAIPPTKGVSPQRMERNKALFESLAQTIIQQYPCETLAELPLDEWPFDEGCKDIKEHAWDVYMACYMIFLCLTGARKNELESLRGDTLEKRLDGTYQFASEIIKTNYGIKTLRDISGLAAEAVDTLLTIGMLEKADTDTPLFMLSTWVPAAHQRIDDCNGGGKALDIAKKSLVGAKLRLVYDRFVEKYGESYRQCHEKITPHQFRHTFAEFALRRFDGRVYEAIRDHFRHSYGSYMTGNYTNGKLDETTDTALNRQYLIELMGRYVEGKEELFGPIGRLIRDRVADYEFVDIDILEEIVSTEFEGRVEAHEWGFCVMRSETKSQAQCYDKVTATPKTQEATFSQCGGCVHRLTLGNQTENVHRIGISLQHHVEEYPLKIVADSYRESLKRAEAIMMEEEDA